jgi:hypothetical protein
MEALADILMANPRSALGSYDEIVALFGGLDAYRSGGKANRASKDRGALLKAWSGGQYRVNRKGNEPILVENWQFSILGGIQIRRVRELSTRGEMDNDGMMQRFLFGFCETETPPTKRQLNLQQVLHRADRWAAVTKLHLISGRAGGLFALPFPEGGPRTDQRASRKRLWTLSRMMTNCF